MDDELKKLISQNSYMDTSNKYPDTGREKPSAIGDVGRGEYMKALGSLAEPLDSYFGVPYRETAYNLAKTSGQDSGPLDYAKAAWKGLSSAGNDPRASHTGYDVANQMLPGNDNVGLKTALATGIDVSDLGTMMPMGAVGKAFGKGAMMAGTVEDMGKAAQAVKGMSGERELAKIGNLQFPAKNAATALAVQQATKDPQILARLKASQPELYEKMIGQQGKTATLGSLKPPEMRETLGGQSVNMRHEMPNISPEDIQAAMEYAPASALSPEAKKVSMTAAPRDKSELLKQLQDIKLQQRLQSVK